ncbi:MAG: sulfite exporter TauE/SafE family protein [Patescibacteria group bacterium]|jgi:sulfite exporter TauE/SafE/copper chaperone CopZ
MPSLNKFNLPIKGLRCQSCEILVENRLKEVAGVVKAEISQRLGLAEIYYDKEKPELNQIAEAIKSAGYSLGEEEAKGLISKNLADYKDLGMALLFLLGLYFLLKGLGLANINILPSDNGGVTMPLILLIGLTAGISTCMALVGGLILGLAVKHNELHPEASTIEKFRPHLFFNLGRIISFAFFGGLLGLLGSTIELSSMALGILTIAVGLVMLIMGLQLIEIFPWANKLKLTLPKSIGRALGAGEDKKEYSHANSMILGGLTFFLPCGFTQAMQVLAVSTGSLYYGAAVMGLFALGTAPGLLGIGGLTSIIKKSLAKKFFKFSGLVVIAFAIFNISNGLGLTGWNLTFSQARDFNVNDPNVILENNIQIVKMKELANGYSPNNFTVKLGIPVKWVIDAEAPYSCAASLVMAKYNIRKNLVKGENIIEFTPRAAGRVPFSCSMGMYTGAFNVVE